LLCPLILCRLWKAYSYPPRTPQTRHRLHGRDDIARPSKEPPNWTQSPPPSAAPSPNWPPAAGSSCTGDRFVVWSAHRPRRRLGDGLYQCRWRGCGSPTSRPHASRASKKFRLNEGGVSTQDPRLCRLLRPLDFRKEYFHPIFEVVVGGALLLPTLDRKLGAVQIENGPP